MAQQTLTPTNTSKLFTTMVCTLSFLLLLCILAFLTLHPPTSPAPPHISSQNALHFHQIFISSAANYTLSAYLKALTEHPHVAGTQPSLQTAEYVETHFKNMGLDTHVTQFEALLSYPSKTSITVQFRDGSKKDLVLTEPGQAGRVIDPYHAYSPSGEVFGELVFVNYGREEDYRTLLSLGVNVSGCVAVVRRGDVSRGGVVRKARENGVAAVLLYADGDTFNGVERGTVMRGLGDPLTPGWGDVEGGEKLGFHDIRVLNRFPEIPSLPISVGNAEIILKSLEGVMVPNQWRDTLQSQFGCVGVGPTLVNFTHKVFIIYLYVMAWKCLLVN